MFIALGLGFLATNSKPAKAYSNNNMIENAIFDAKGSMSEQDIRNFINSRPNTCFTRVGANLGGGNIYPRPVTYFSYGPAMTDAAGVIYEAAQYNDINPKVIISTLQKEQSLFTDNDCYDPQGFASLPKAMGYGCFEGPGAACPPAAYAGFHQQVMKGAWQLGFDRNRAENNIGWGGNDNINYGGRMTQGFRRRCASCSLIYYDGYSIIDGQNTFIQNGATAALFNYTPHLNQSFPIIFESFFGSGSTTTPPSLACKTGVNQINADNGLDILPRKFGGSNDLLTLTQQNNTFSKCIEMHTWTGNFQQWIEHTASNRDVIAPVNSKIISADTNGDGYDEMILVEMNGTNSGKIEFHVWDRSNQVWIAHIASNHPSLDPATADVISADTDGDNRDEIYLVRYNSTASGKIEVHGWTPNMQQWFAHIATNHPSVDKSASRILAGDTNGDNRDELFLVHYNGTTSGKIELHGWTPNMQQWFVHTATNHPVLNTADVKVELANITGGREDEFLLIKYPTQATGGKVELHGWTSGQQGWFLHTVAVSVP